MSKAINFKEAVLNDIGYVVSAQYQLTIERFRSILKKKPAHYGSSNMGSMMANGPAGHRATAGRPGLRRRMSIGIQ